MTTTYRYRYRGVGNDLSKFPQSSGKTIADSYIRKLPFQCKTDGALTEEDVARSTEVAKEMKIQANRWEKYKTNMSNAMEQVPDIISAQNQIRSGALSMGTKVIKSDASVEVDGAKHWVEGEKVFQSTQGKINNVLFGGRLASGFIKAQSGQERTRVQYQHNLDTRFGQQQNTQQTATIKERYQQRVAQLGQARNVYTLGEKDIQYEKMV